jgi:hypothetical protein
MILMLTLHPNERVTKRPAQQFDETLSHKRFVGLNGV